MTFSKHPLTDETLRNSHLQTAALFYTRKIVTPLYCNIVSTKCAPLYKSLEVFGVNEIYSEREELRGKRSFKLRKALRKVSETMF